MVSARMMRSMLLGSVVTLTAIALVVPASAGAATTIGQAAPLDATLRDCGVTSLRVQHNPAYTIPSAGVLTAWSTTGNGISHRLELKVVRGNPPASQNWLVTGTSSIESFTEATVHTFATRIPVVAGDEVALYVPDAAAGTPCAFGTASALDSFFYGSTDIADPAVGTSAMTSAEDFSYRLNVAARLEPDADGDGYGDETQDGCPTSSATHGSCPLPPDKTPPQTTLTDAPTKVKLKKGRRSTMVSFAFISSEAGSTFTCKLDDKPTVACASPLTAKVRKGPHVFTVAAKDKAGNVDATPARAEFVVKKHKKKRRHR